MKPRRATLGLEFYLGTIQYCVALFGGGAVWFLTAHFTNFFGDDPTIKIAACLLLIALILAESWWAHIPGSGSELTDYIIDILTSALIAAFGMAIAAAVFIWLPG